MQFCDAAAADFCTLRNDLPANFDANFLGPDKVQFAMLKQIGPRKRATAKPEGENQLLTLPSLNLCRAH